MRYVTSENASVTLKLTMLPALGGEELLKPGPEENGQFAIKFPDKDLLYRRCSEFVRLANGTDDAKKVAEYVERITPMFRRIVGRRPRGVPFLIKASVAGTGESGKNDAFEHLYFVEANRRDVEKTLKRR